MAATQDLDSLSRWICGATSTPPPGVDKEWRDAILERTAAFWSWYEEFTGARHKSPGQLGYRATLPRDSLAGVSEDVHIVGLDSAWLCGAECEHQGRVLKDQGSIAVTEDQVLAHIRDGEEPVGGYRIALIHHPLDHLVDHHNVRRLLGDGGVDLLLHGHQHEATSMVTSEGGESLRVLAAGCLIEGELGKNWPNEFHVIDVDVPSRAGEVHFREWSARARTWALGTGFYRNAPSGTLRWSAGSGSTSAPAPPTSAPSPEPGPGDVRTSGDVSSDGSASNTELLRVDNHGATIEQQVNVAGNIGASHKTIVGLAVVGLFAALVLVFGSSEEARRSVCDVPGVRSGCEWAGVGTVATRAELDLWEQAQRDDSGGGLRKYLAAYPVGRFAVEAQARLSACQTVSDSSLGSPTELRRQWRVNAHRSKSFDSQAEAQRDARERGQAEAKNFCSARRSVEVLDSIVEIDAWDCVSRDGAHECGFDGQIVCRVRERVITTREVCPRP